MWNNRAGSGLMHNPPFVVPVDVPPHLNDYLPLFTGYVLANVTQGATKNQARALFKNLLESDNNALGEVVQSFANVVSYYIDAEQLGPGQVEQCMANCVGMVVNAYLGYAVQTYQNDFAPVVNQQMFEESKSYIGQLERVKNEAQMYYNGGRGNWNHSNRGGGAAAPQRGWQPPQRAAMGRGGQQGWQRNNAAPASRWDEPVQTGGGNAGGMQYQSAQDGWPGNRMGSRNTGLGSSVWADGPTPATKPQAEGFDGSGNVRPRRQFTNPHTPTHAPQEERPRMAPNQTLVDGIVFTSARTDMTWPKVRDLDRLWDWVLFEDGTQLRPVYQSRQDGNWKITYDPTQPAPPLYDPQTHILFKIRSPEGAVSYEAIQREPTMEYLDHELDPELRRKAQVEVEANQGKVAAAWQLVEQLRPNPSSPLATSEPLYEDGEGMGVTATAPDQFLLTTDLGRGVKRSLVRLKVDNPEINSGAFELYVDQAILTTVLEPDYVKLTQLQESKDFQKLHASMDDLQGKELFEAVNGRVTEVINRFLKERLGLVDWSIDSFYEDFADLRNLLLEKHGRQVLESFQDCAQEMIFQALTFFSSDDLTAAHKLLDLKDDDNVLIWRERSSVTQLPVSNSELGLDVGDSGVMVKETSHNALYKTFSAVFNRTLDLPLVYRGRYIATSDGVVYALVRGMLNLEAILIHKAPFRLN